MSKRDLVESQGFEPRMPEATDLQSAEVTNASRSPWVVERRGIEPLLQAWKACVLTDRRTLQIHYMKTHRKGTIVDLISARVASPGYHGHYCQTIRRFSGSFFHDLEERILPGKKRAYFMTDSSSTSADVTTLPMPLTGLVTLMCLHIGTDWCQCYMNSTF